MSALLLAVVAFALGTCLGASMMLLVTRRHRLELHGNATLILRRPLPVRRLMLLTACSASASAVTVFYLSTLH